jgi:hypothetical protein
MFSGVSLRPAASWIVVPAPAYTTPPDRSLAPPSYPRSRTSTRAPASAASMAAAAPAAP